MPRVGVLDGAITAGWLPALVTGQAVLGASDSELRYATLAGGAVIVTGRNFRLDEAGQALRGVVETLTLFSAAGEAVLRIEGIHARLDTLMRFALGLATDDGAIAADGTALLTHLLRGGDVVYGSGGNDSLLALGGAGPGNDTIYGGAGEDLIRGDAGNDSLVGGAQADVLSYDSSLGDALAFQGITLDVVLGQVTDCWGGTDQFREFEAYRDSVFDDRLVGSAAASETWHLTRGADTLLAGGGVDWLDFAASAAMGGRRGIVVDLAAGRVRDAWGELDRISGVEGVGGTARADVMLGDAFDNSFDGRAGQDSFDGRAGFDRLGFWGVTGSQGVVIDMALASGQVLNDGFGHVESVLGIEAFTLSALDDRFDGSEGADNVRGGAGNDTLTGRGGEDYLYGDDGDDVILGGDDSSHIAGGAGRDQLTGSSRDDDFTFVERGAENADTIFGFNGEMDQIYLPVSWGGLAVGAISSVMLRVGAGVQEAVTASQRLLYDTATGELRFDRDGAGGGAAEIFAVIDNRVMLTWQDFWVLG